MYLGDRDKRMTSQIIYNPFKRMVVGLYILNKYISYTHTYIHTYIPTVLNSEYMLISSICVCMCV